MPTYILCSSLTAGRRQTLHTQPRSDDRGQSGDRRIWMQAVGQYATLGIYDFVTIIERRITRRSPTCRSI